MNKDNFVYYGSWNELLNMFPTDELKKEFIWNVFLIGTGNEMDTENIAIQSLINGAIIPNITAAKKKYNTAKENGSKGGRPRIEFDAEKATELQKSGYTIQKIADEMGVSKNTAAERLKEYKTKNQKPEIKTGTENPINNHYKDIYTYTDIEKEKEKEKEIDSPVVSFSGFSNIERLEEQEQKEKKERERQRLIAEREKKERELRKLGYTDTEIKSYMRLGF